MTDTYRALCAELTNELSGYKMANPMHDRFLLNRARAALAAEPAPFSPDGEVADPVIPGEYRGFNAVAYRNGFHAGYKHALTRAVLAAPLPPADEEVAELVAWLRCQKGQIPGSYTEFDRRIDRAADLLERLAPQPLPEREGPTNQDIEALHQAVFASRLHGPPPNTSCEVDLVRAALARWSQS